MVKDQGIFDDFLFIACKLQIIGNFEIEKYT